MSAMTFEYATEPGVAENPPLVTVMMVPDHAFGTEQLYVFSDTAQPAALVPDIVMLAAVAPAWYVIIPEILCAPGVVANVGGGAGVEVGDGEGGVVAT